ncbi:MAG: TIGR02147 family protein [Fibrobacteria bacterium]|nr:TIGR02147 family protein [Fibrobacteria bacterium]
MDESLSVFGFRDYHEFLGEWVGRERALRPSFSYQWLANRAGIKSRSFLRMVCVGEKDLSKSSAMRLAQAIGLDEVETEYFLTLVDLNNAEDPGEKSMHATRLLKIAPPSRRSPLSAQHYDLFETWWMIPLWEIACAVRCGEDWGFLGSQLDPPISPEDAERGIRSLVDLGLLVRDGDGYQRREASLHTPEEVRSRAIQKYQDALMDMAKGALRRVPTSKRHISTVTFGVDEATMARIHERIRQMRTEIVDIVQTCAAPDRVYQLNLQLFPLSKAPLDLPPKGVPTA